jgi:hypothetical protein
MCVIKRKWLRRQSMRSVYASSSRGTTFRAPKYGGKLEANLRGEMVDLRERVLTMRGILKGNISERRRCTTTHAALTPSEGDNFMGANCFIVPPYLDSANPILQGGAE